MIKVRLNLAYRAFMQGEEKAARSQLQAMLRLDGDHAVATSLLQQIKQPAGRFFKRRFGERYFTYKVQEGDSLATIALDFLHDPYLFYALAKYNHVAIPGKLMVGQLLRIPGSRPAIPAAERHYRIAEDFYAQKNYQEVIDYLESKNYSAPQRRQPSRFIILMARAYSELAKQRLENNDFSGARSYLQLASELPYDDKLLRAGLVQIQRNLDMREYMAAGTGAARPEDIHLIMAYRAFMKGDEDLARAHLQGILASNPDNAVATSLLQQIKLPAGQFFKQRFGKQYFTYRIREGDSLATISFEFLHDQYLFYALAKFNNIRQPGHLQVGKTIRIPWKPAKRDRLTRHEGGKRDTQTSSDLPNSKNARKQSALLAKSYLKQANILQGKDDLLQAQAYLERASTISPADIQIKTQLRNITRTLEMRKYLAQAEKRIQARQWRQAYTALREVLRRDPDHAPSKRKLQQLKSKVIDKPYRKCVLAYRLRQFDKAAQLCDNVLQIDPDHILAKEKRDRARAIDVRLQALKAEIEKDNREHAGDAGGKTITSTPMTASGLE